MAFKQDDDVNVLVPGRVLHTQDNGNIKVNIGPGLGVLWLTPRNIFPAASKLAEEAWRDIAGDMIRAGCDREALDLLFEQTAIGDYLGELEQAQRVLADLMANSGDRFVVRTGNNEVVYQSAVLRALLLRIADCRERFEKTRGK